VNGLLLGPKDLPSPLGSQKSSNGSRTGDAMGTPTTPRQLGRRFEVPKDTGGTGAPGAHASKNRLDTLATPLHPRRAANLKAVKKRDAMELLRAQAFAARYGVEDEKHSFTADIEAIKTPSVPPTKRTTDHHQSGGGALLSEKGGVADGLSDARMSTQSSEGNLDRIITTTTTSQPQGSVSSPESTLTAAIAAAVPSQPQSHHQQQQQQQSSEAPESRSTLAEPLQPPPAPQSARVNRRTLQRIL